MAIFKGTSKTSFSDFEDPNSAVGSFLSKSYSALKNYLQQANAMISENTFVEDGVQSVPGFSNFDAGFSNIKEPSPRKTYSQTPKTTIFIKKRIFSSLRNNFDPEAPSKKGAGIGLKNIRERLRLTYKSEGLLQTSKTENTFEVKLMIPQNE